MPFEGDYENPKSIFKTNTIQNTLLSITLEISNNTELVIIQAAQGAGKTFLLKYLYQILPYKSYEAIFSDATLNNKRKNDEYLFSHLARFLGVKTENLSMGLEAVARENRKLIWFIDNADQLSKNFANSIKNLQKENNSNFILILTCINNVADQLKSDRHSLYKMHKFTIQEATDYIAWELARLNLPSIFNQEEIYKIYSSSKGIPRAMAKTAKTLLLQPKKINFTKNVPPPHTAITPIDSNTKKSSSAKVSEKPKANHGPLEPKKASIKEFDSLFFRPDIKRSRP